MPYINVSVTGKPDAALSKKIASKVSGLTGDILKKDPSVTSISVTYVNPEHWFAGGRSLAEQGMQTYWLTISVTAGTNTKDEMAKYLQAVRDAFYEMLGGVNDVSYALVNEVPAPAYGYNGKSQEHRFIASQIEA